MVLGFEKIGEIEKLVKDLNQKVTELDVEVNVLRNEVRDLRARLEGGRK